MTLTAKNYLTQLLIETEGYDAVGRKKLKRDLIDLLKIDNK